MDAAEGQQQFNTNNSLLLSVSGAIKNISVSVRISLWLAIKANVIINQKGVQKAKQKQLEISAKN